MCLFLMLTAINNLSSQVGNTLAFANATGELGDVDNSGTINIIDALLVSQYYVELYPDDFDPEAADVDCNGSINIVDALLISQYYVSLIDVFPCPAPEPDPPKIMFVSAHPDDEGIFFGGAIPYYTQVLKVPTVHMDDTDVPVTIDFNEEDLGTKKPTFIYTAMGPSYHPQPWGSWGTFAFLTPEYIYVVDGDIAGQVVDGKVSYKFNFGKKLSQAVQHLGPGWRFLVQTLIVYDDGTQKLSGWDFLQVV